MKKSDIFFKPISLLPPENKKELSVLISMKHIVLFSGIVLVLASLMYISTPILFLSQNQELNKVEADINTINQEISGMQRYEVVFNKEKKYVNILKNAMGESPDWDYILTDIFTNKPLGIIINSAKASKNLVVVPVAPTSPLASIAPVIPNSNSGFTIFLDGTSQNIGDLSFWIKTLKEQSLYKNVELGSVTLGAEGYSYQLTISISESLPYDYKKGVSLDDKEEKK